MAGKVSQERVEVKQQGQCPFKVNLELHYTTTRINVNKKCVIITVYHVFRDLSGSLGNWSRTIGSN
jgi:hypothetical protein